MENGTDHHEVNGVNLDNYLPYQRNFDTVLYVHKRVLKQNETGNLNTKKVKEDKKKKNKINKPTPNKANNETGRNESVIEQTVRFAKRLAPMMIPPTEDAPVFYTVETCKCKRKNKIPKEVPADDVTYENKSKKIIETFRRDKKHDRKSVTESVTSQSTLDDMNINQSLSCTMSEQSDKREKYVKNEVNSKRKRNKDKFVISESFEAVATELTDSDTKIKVQMMNSAEKNAFCDSIRSPVLEAVRKCLSEFHSVDRDEIRAVQRVVKCNTDKLDKILEKLANIEKHLEHKKMKKSPRTQGMASTLEQLGEDIDEINDEEYECKNIKVKRVNDDNREMDFGCGEAMRPSTSVGVKTDRLNKIPARFCWTDADKD